KFRLRLAEEVVGSKDARTWDIRLKDGIEFHNGKPLRLEDVIFTFKRRAKKGGTFATQYSAVASVRKTGPRSVRVKLKRPVSIFEVSFGNTSWILPENFDPKKPVGTGPYKLVSAVNGRKTVMTANANWWGPGPYVERL